MFVLVLCVGLCCCVELGIVCYWLLVIGDFMLGMSYDVILLFNVVIVIFVLILMIMCLCIYFFIVLIIILGFFGLIFGMLLFKIVKFFQDGFGGVFGFVGIVFGLGIMLGKLMVEFGGVDQILQMLVCVFGCECVYWVMMMGVFLVGIFLFFEIGFVLLILLVFIVVCCFGVLLFKIGMFMLVSLLVMYGLVLLYLGLLLVIGIFGVDIGKIIFYGLLVGLLIVIIVGLLFGVFILCYVDIKFFEELMV